jgi:hypothetical protein
MTDMHDFLKYLYISAFDANQQFADFLKNDPLTIFLFIDRHSHLVARIKACSNTGLIFLRTNSLQKCATFVIEEIEFHTKAAKNPNADRYLINYHKESIKEYGRIREEINNIYKMIA